MGGNTSKPELYDPRDWVDTPKDELVLQPFAYPSCGLYKAFEELENAYPHILTLSIEEQSEYADAITRRYALNPHFNETQLESLNPEHDGKILGDPNSTSIGNMAFMAIHHPNSAWSVYYERVIGLLKEQDLTATQ